jgi:hypothetical protein
LFLPFSVLFSVLFLLSSFLCRLFGVSFFVYKFEQEFYKVVFVCEILTFGCLFSFLRVAGQVRAAV